MEVLLVLDNRTTIKGSLWYVKNLEQSDFAFCHFKVHKIKYQYLRFGGFIHSYCKVIRCYNKPKKWI